MSAAQPPKEESYTAPSNPTTRTPAEASTANEARARDAAQGRAPVPQSQARSADDAVPSSLGQGVHSSGPVDETERRNTARAPAAAASGPENPNVEAEQMGTFAEGEVADAVQRKSGAQNAPGQRGVEIDDFASGLEKKKREQREAREAVKEERREGVDVDGGFGRREGNEDNRDV